MAYVLLAEPERAAAAAIAKLVTEITKLPCTVVHDGAEGHAVLAREGVPSILISDLVLPKREGISLVRGLRRADPERRAKVITYSAFANIRKAASDLERELGPLVVLQKPVATATMTAALRSATAGDAKVAPVHPATALPDEAARLARIDELGLMRDAAPDPELQSVVADVAKTFGASSALVTLVLENDLFLEAHAGPLGEGPRKRPRAWSFCEHVVEGRDALVVPDARASPAFAENPYVRDGTVCGYAGAPIVTPQGDVLGSLCIIDTKPLDVGADDVARLRVIARQVAGRLQLAGARRKGKPAGEATTRPAVLSALEATAETFPFGVVVFGPDGSVLSVNGSFLALFRIARDNAIGVPRGILVQRIARAFADPEAALERLVAPEQGPFAFCEDLALAGPAHLAVRWSAAPVEIPGGLIQVASVF